MKLGSIFVGLAALLALSACGSSGDAVPSDQAVQPTKGKAAWPVTDVDGVTINTPSAWDKTGPIDARPGQLYTFQTPTNSFGTRGGAQLVTLDKRKQSAEKMVKALGDEAVAVAGAKEVTSTPVKWPGATSAWYLTYVAYPPHDGKTAPHPTQVLVVDFGKVGQAQATVTALQEDFAPQQMHAILETLTITDKAGTKSS